MSLGHGNLTWKAMSRYGINISMVRTSPAFVLLLFIFNRTRYRRNIFFINTSSSLVAAVIFTRVPTPNDFFVYCSRLTVIPIVRFATFLPLLLKVINSY